MRITARPLAPDEIDYELITLSVTVAALALLIGWNALHLPWPICAFHALTAHPCATCGATRSAIAFFHGQFMTSARWNPLAFAAYCGISIFDSYALIVLITRARRLRVTQMTLLEKNIVRALVVAMLALNWIYLLAHTRNFA
ncbi:MAG: hypothetical protein JWO95_217 [Verrucomicrobiales bacterium]|nr:hypothetical protein [Verrucomicrobiales bacterium]